MTDRKTWTVSLYKGADADPGYKRLTNWSLKEEGTPTVYAHTYDADGNPNYIKLKPVYQMKLSSIVVPNREINFDINQIDFYDIYNCNYLVAQADYDANKIYYGFVDLIDYVNDGTVKINWKVDYWATYKDKINLAKAQYVSRAMYTPKSYMLDARRTVDSSLPTDEKQRLAYVKNITDKVVVKNATDNQFVQENNFDSWYLFYLMPKSDLKAYFPDNNYPDIDTDTRDQDTTIKEDLTYRDLSGTLTKDQLTDVANLGWINLDKAFKPLQASFYDLTQDVEDDLLVTETDYNNVVRVATPDVYASTSLNAVYSLNLIAGDGVAILGCEVRNALDLSNFTEVTAGLYKYTGSSYFYEVDNHMGYVDDTQHKFSNTYDKNRYREEITVAGKSLSVDPSLRMDDTPGVHIWDSIMPGFKPIYSFYFVNGQIAPLSPRQAGDKDLVVKGDVDRSIPLYANNALSYYLSHLSRINAEIQKQICGWKAQIKNSQISFENQLATIAKNYSVSLIDLKNSLYNSTGLAQFNNTQDKGNLKSTYDNTTTNAKAQNGIDNTMLANSQSAESSNLSDSNGTSLENLKNSNQVSLSNLGDSNGVAWNNLHDSNEVSASNLENAQIVAANNLSKSNATSLDNLAKSQQIASSNLSKSQTNNENNLTSSQATSIGNLKTANEATVKNLNASNDTSNTNAEAQAKQNKANLDTNLTNQKNNLELQKAESYITGLNLTAGLAQFLTGALTSLITGYLDIETAETVATNNTQTQKSIIDANLELQTDTINKNNLSLALSNLENTYSASVSQATNSNSTALANLKNSNSVAIANLKASQAQAYKNLQNSQTQAESNLGASQVQEYKNLQNSQTQAENNLNSSNTQAYTNLKNSQTQAEANLTRSQKVAIKNLAQSYQKTLNSLALGFDNSNLNLSNSLAKILNSLNQNNALQQTNFNNDKVKAYILAKMAQNASQEQLANTITASVNSYVTGIKAQVEDWNRGNWSKLTDGNGIALQVLHLLDAQDKIYEVQASTERQIKDKIYTTGAFVNRKIPLKTLLMQPDLASGELVDYFLNSGQTVPQVTNKLVIHDKGYPNGVLYGDDSTDNKLYIRQYVQTEGVQLEGNAPTEALQTLQNALNSGVYLTIDHCGRTDPDETSDTNTDGKSWNMYNPDSNYALNTDSSDHHSIQPPAVNSMADNPDWNNVYNPNVETIVDS